MKILQTPVFLLSELTQSQQEKAHENYMCNEFEFFSEFVIEDAITMLAKLGIEVENVYFSGFSSQGDGACFEGRLQAYPKGGLAALVQEYPDANELHELARDYVKAQAKGFYRVRGTVKQSGHYMHSGCTSFDLYDEEFDYNRAIPEDEIIESCRALMDYIYKSLQNEYDYQSSFESFKDSCAANEWHFTEAGEMKNF